MRPWWPPARGCLQLKGSWRDIFSLESGVASDAPGFKVLGSPVSGVEREALGVLSGDGERVVAWTCGKGLVSPLLHKRSMGSISRSGKVSWAKARALDVAEGSARSMWGVLFLLHRSLFGGRKTDDGPRLPRQSRRRRLPNPTHRTNLTFPPDRRPTPVRWGQRRCGCESCSRLAGLRRSHWQRPPAPL